MELSGNMKSVVRLTIVFLVLFAVSVCNAKRVKPRAIATTDGEKDDLTCRTQKLI